MTSHHPLLCCSVLAFILTLGLPAAPRAQEAGSIVVVPRSPENVDATLAQLDQLLRTQGCTLTGESLVGGILNATCPQEGTVHAVGWKSSNGFTGLWITCTGISQASVNARCIALKTTLQNQHQEPR